MRKDLMLLLADKLETIPENKFGMSLWMAAYEEFGRFKRAYAATRNWNISPFKTIKNLLPGKVNAVEPIECQTAGCAMGWATTMPEFQAEGLTLIQFYSDARPHLGQVILKDAADDIILYDIEAASNVLDIPKAWATYLFGPLPWAYRGIPDPTPKQVSQAIRDAVIKIEKGHLNPLEIPNEMLAPQPR